MYTFQTKGKVVKVLPLETVSSKDGKKTWTKLNFVLDNGNERDNLLYVEVFGDEKVNDFNYTVKEGGETICTIKASSNKYTKNGNDYYFNKFSLLNIATPVDTNSNPTNMSASHFDPPSDLPF